MENNNTKLEFHTGYFSGKTLVKKGTRTDKDGNQINWKLYNLEIKTYQDSPYGTKFKCFDSCKGFELLDELEGEPMKVGFKRGTYIHSEHGLQESRSVVLIQSGKKEDITQYESSIKKQKAQPLQEMTEEEMDKNINDIEEQTTNNEETLEPTEDEEKIVKLLIEKNYNVGDVYATLLSYKQQGKNIPVVTEKRSMFLYNKYKNI